MTSKPHTYINIGNMILVTFGALFLYFVAGSIAIDLKERFHNILAHSVFIQGCYFLMIIVMLLCSITLFICGILLWKYDEKS